MTDAITLRLQAARDLLKRYAAVFRHVWALRRELDPPPRLAHEAAFLPAALELQESPVSPAPRAVAWLLMAFALIALLWAVFGWIDVVAVAQGRIVPNAGSKLIQPIETAAVKAIHVADGQAVKAGQVLVELDATQAVADSTRSANDLATERLEAFATSMGALRLTDAVNWSGFRTLIVAAHPELTERLDWAAMPRHAAGASPYGVKGAGWADYPDMEGVAMHDRLKSRHWRDGGTSVNDDAWRAAA